MTPSKEQSEHGNQENGKPENGNPQQTDHVTLESDKSETENECHTPPK